MIIVVALVGAGLVGAGALLFRRRWWLGTPVVALGVLVLVAGVVGIVQLRAYRIPSENMLTTLEVDDRVTAWRGDAGVGDVAVYHPPAGAVQPDGPRCGADVAEDELCPRPAGGRSDLTFVARVVAAGGDRVRIQDGRVIRNGRPADEPYARPCGTGPGCTFRDEITVPRGTLYVLGDNRGASDDSRFWGPVREDWVVGRVVLRYWPPSRLGSP